MARQSFQWGNGIGFMAGIVVFVSLLLFPVPQGLSVEAWRTAALALLMGVWWLSEALPIPVTALLPIVLLPVLNITSISGATSPYANPLIFLFLGGFIIAVAMERWDLHRRIALNIVRFVGTRPASIIMGFILASAFLSMWVSNTATALMMLPIGLSILKLVENQKEGAGKMNFEIVLVLSIAYGCNIGGMATIIGTPPNALLAGFMNETYGLDIGFAQWMMVGVPLMVVALPILYFMLTKVIYPIEIDVLPGGKALIDEQLSKLGAISSAEKKVAAVFIGTALLWITRPLLAEVLPGLSDAGIAIAAALTLFMIPENVAEGRFLLSWTDAEELPWGVLILFGGGLSLASAISETGLADWIGGGVGSLGSWSILALVGLVVVMIVFLTEITSNTATTAAFLPIVASVTIGLGENPLLLAVPAALAASCAFMLPVATPPNAIVYGSKKITIPEMSRAGLWLNMIFIVLLTGAAFSLITWVFGIETGVLPSWAG
ncbi:SLC13 family permease [Fodinibius halophilus]|uniref:DASS family sodium-coupled anion symporter n=1 Tax=Fodinibius halophilus TaxID=1736908 RepID=A0A6M1TA77_9BACT|nr:DASS family sodium-coupled anion symporter [Fodinibius halophilus]NGP89363.1 DASS family sodium-coupled anion symporter [Fodinibius halophilus]